MSWRDFRLARPQKTTFFRLSVRPARYYEQPFPEGIFRAFRLSCSGSNLFIYGYAMVDTDIERRLVDLLPGEESVCEVLVGIAFPPGLDRRKELVEITSLRSDTWVVDYQDGERHFDLPAAGAGSPAVEDGAGMPEDPAAIEETPSVEALDTEADTRSTPPPPAGS